MNNIKIFAVHIDYLTVNLSHVMQHCNYTYLMWFTPTDAVAFTNARFGTGAGPIYLDEVGCTGSESNLLNCSQSSLVSCRQRGAGVRCQGRYEYSNTSRNQT